MKLIWLDDCRNPFENDWLVFSPISILNDDVIWVKSYDQFVNWIKENGLPDGICFDHDLGQDIALEGRAKGLSKRAARKLKKGMKTGKDCANWLVEYCLDNNLDLPKYNIQSANPVGKENIKGLLEGYIKFRQNNIKSL